MLLKTCTGVAICLLVALSPPAAAGEPGGCQAQALNPDEVRELIKRWSGLAIFNHWRIVSLAIDPCIQDGQVPATLVLGTPEGWSDRGVDFRVTVPLKLDGSSGAPAPLPNGDWRKLAGATRNFIHTVESHEDVRGFLERYPPVQGEIAYRGASGKLQATLNGTFEAGRLPPGVPQLVFVENTPGKIVSYRVPRLDGLPVRRELLRFGELVSLRHPGCFPAWFEARQSSTGEGADDVVAWTLEVTLKGDGCPSCYSAMIGPNGQVSEPPPPEQPADGH